MSQRYLHNYRQQPQGLEYVDPGESIQDALNRARMVVLVEGEHSAPAGLTLREGQWLCGLGPESRLVLGAQITLASNSTLSDMAVRIIGGYGNNRYAVRGHSVETINIRNLSLDGAVEEQTWGPGDNGQIGLGFTGSTVSVDIDNVYVHGFTKDCVYVDGGTDINVSRSHFQNFSRGGVVSVDVDGLYVADCVFEDGRDLSTVIGNHGVWLEPDNAQAHFLRVNVKRCTFRNLNRGCYFHNNSQVANAIVETDNTFEDCRYMGVWSYYCALRSSFSRFDACGTARDLTAAGVLDGAEAAFSLFNAGAVRVRGHEFKDCSGVFASLEVGPGCRGAHISDCLFDGDLKSAIHAQYVFGSDTRRRFLRNACSGGSVSSSGTYAAILLEGTASHPIDSDEATDNVVDIDTYAAAVSSTYTDGGRFEPNHVSGTTGSGQTVTNSAPGVAYANVTPYAAGRSDRVILSNLVADSAREITLPASPFIGQPVTVKDSKGDAATYNITVTPDSGTIDGASSASVTSNYGVLRLVRGLTEWHVV